MHILSKEIWDGHPCCSFAASREFITSSPNSFAALTRVMVDATPMPRKPKTASRSRRRSHRANYINAPVTVLEQVLTGTYADGLGGVRPTPSASISIRSLAVLAVWMLTQMKRWGQIKGDVDYKAVAEQVYLATDTRKVMAEMGLTPPTTAYKSFSVMGKTFDRKSRTIRCQLQDQEGVVRACLASFLPPPLAGRGIGRLAAVLEGTPKQSFGYVALAIRVRGHRSIHTSRAGVPLTPTLSPQAGRGR